MVRHFFLGLICLLAGTTSAMQKVLVSKAKVVPNLSSQELDLFVEVVRKVAADDAIYQCEKVIKVYTAATIVSYIMVKHPDLTRSVRTVIGKYTTQNDRALVERVVADFCREVANTTPENDTLIGPKEMQKARTKFDQHDPANDGIFDMDL